MVQHEAVKRGPLAAGPCGVGRHCRWHVQAVVSAAPMATEVATPSGKKNRPGCGLGGTACFQKRANGPEGPPEVNRAFFWCAMCLFCTKADSDHIET